MLVKCICTNCAGHLEFEEENAGQKIACPHCGFQTTLFLPGQEPDDSAEGAGDGQPSRRTLVIFILVGVTVAAGAGYALYHWGMPLVEEQFPSIESRLGRVLLLILGCLLVPVALFWLCFPILLLTQMRKMNRALQRIADNSTPVEATEEGLEDESAPEHIHN